MKKLRNCCISGVILGLILLCTSSAHATEYVWNTSSGSGNTFWSNNANWTPNGPLESNIATTTLSLFSDIDTYHSIPPSGDPATPFSIHNLVIATGTLSYTGQITFSEDLTTAYINKTTSATANLDTTTMPNHDIELDTNTLVIDTTNNLDNVSIYTGTIRGSATAEIIIKDDAPDPFQAVYFNGAATTDILNHSTTLGSDSTNISLKINGGYVIANYATIHAVVTLTDGKMALANGEDTNAIIEANLTLATNQQDPTTSASEFILANGINSIAQLGTESHNITARVEAGELRTAVGAGSEARILGSVVLTGGSLYLGKTGVNSTAYVTRDITSTSADVFLRTQGSVSVGREAEFSNIRLNSTSSMVVSAAATGSSKIYSNVTLTESTAFHTAATTATAEIFGNVTLNDSVFVNGQNNVETVSALSDISAKIRPLASATSPITITVNEGQFHNGGNATITIPNVGSQPATPGMGYIQGNVVLNQDSFFYNGAFGTDSIGGVVGDITLDHATSRFYNGYGTNSQGVATGGNVTLNHGEFHNGFRRLETGSYVYSSGVLTSATLSVNNSASFIAYRNSQQDVGSFTIGTDATFATEVFTNAQGATEAAVLKAVSENGDGSGEIADGATIKILNGGISSLVDNTKIKLASAEAGLTVNPTELVLDSSEFDPAMFQLGFWLSKDSNNLYVTYSRITEYLDIATPQNQQVAQSLDTARRNSMSSEMETMMITLDGTSSAAEKNQSMTEMQPRQQNFGQMTARITSVAASQNLQGFTTARRLALKGKPMNRYALTIDPARRE